MAPATSEPYSQSHYEILGISRDASTEVIKAAYRRLVKKHHPDASQLDGERIRQINAAYMVLRHTESRQAYDRLLQPMAMPRSVPSQPQETVTDEAAAQQRWIQQVYVPLNRILASLLASLQPELNALSADPFDQELLESFEHYLHSCGQNLQRAQGTFRSHPNPSSLASVATRYYYILNHLEDALEELRYFTLNFDDRHLHTGHELFRRAKGLRSEAMQAMRQMQTR
jgi:molecular chaperone DnaJ